MKRTPGRALTSFAASFAIVAALVGADISAASADSVTCSNSQCGAAYSEWVSEMYPSNYGGWGYWYAAAGHNCTNYVAWRLILNGEPANRSSLGNASQWDTWATSHGVPANSTPAVGSIAQWNGGTGHVAYVESVSGNSITVTEDNYSTGPYRKRVITTSGDWPDNFLHFSDLGGANPMSDGSYRLTNHLQNGTEISVDGLGGDGDIAVSGDWDGDGVDSLGYVRNGQWHLFDGPLKTNPRPLFQFGGTSDIPIVGDWNGDGIDDPGVKRADHWIIDSDQDGTRETYFFGGPTDVPVIGDWNGDGHDTFGVVQGATWKLSNGYTSASMQPSFVYGNSSDVQIVGDWDGDGIDSPGVKRNGTWILTNTRSSANKLPEFSFGLTSDAPLVGDWDGDGSDTMGIAR
jgi:surface antigen